MISRGGEYEELVSVVPSVQGYPGLHPGLRSDRAGAGASYGSFRAGALAAPRPRAGGAGAEKDESNKSEGF